MSNPGAASTATSVFVGGGSPLVFFGTTAVTQQTVPTAVTTTGATSTTNAYGYTTAAQADAIVTAVNSIITKITALTLWA